MIVANHSSYFDLIYLAYRDSPVFTRAFADGSLQTVGMWEVALEGSCPIIDSAGGNGKSLSDILSSVQPVVVFPEVTLLAQLTVRRRLQTIARF